MFKSAEQRKNEIDGTLSPFSPQTVGFSRRVPRKPAEDDPTASSGNPITKNVSVLRTDHAACQAVLFGMRKTAQSHSNRAQGCTTRVNRGRLIWFGSFPFVSNIARCTAFVRGLAPHDLIESVDFSHFALPVRPSPMPQRPLRGSYSWRHRLCCLSCGSERTSHFAGYSVLEAWSPTCAGTGREGHGS